MIFRRLPASSSFVLAAARLRALQLDPPAARREDPGSREEGSRGKVSLAKSFRAMKTPGQDAILQPPKPEITPSARILHLAAEHDIEPEAGG